MELEESAFVAGTGKTAKVGWIGAGKMGAPMIRNLIAAGNTVAVTEPVASIMADLVAGGAVESKTIADQSGRDIVFSTLPNDDILRSVVFGDVAPGLADTLDAGAVYVDMSTVSPDCSREIGERLADAGIHYLRAPLSGSTALAESAQLTIFASGDEAAWRAAEPYLEHLSARRFYLGQADEARYMKLVVNTLVGASSALVSEALALGESGGLSKASMMEVICESAVSSPLLKYKRDAVVTDDYSPAFSIAQMIKDFTLISEAARANGVPMFSTNLILDLYRAAGNTGLMEDDFFALVKWHSGLSKR